LMRWRDVLLEVVRGSRADWGSWWWLVVVVSGGG